jgi:hypothetical protein
MSEPRIIAVGEELPPLIPWEPADRNGDAGTGKANKPKGRAGERFKTLNSFADFTLASLGRAEIAVWLLLWRDTKDGTARTSVADLARRAGCNRATVFRALRRLTHRGLVRIVYRGGLGCGPSRYLVRPLANDG